MHVDLKHTPCARRLLLVRAERFARILASAKLAGRCDSLVTNLRSFAQRSNSAEGSRKVRIPLK